jgi:hypothetical protein
MMWRTDKRRAEIEALIRATKRETSLKGKQIRTVDPLVHRASRMYPYLPEAAILEYARTALKIINNQNRDPQPEAQTTLLTHFA